PARPWISAADERRIDETCRHTVYNLDFSSLKMICAALQAPLALSRKPSANQAQTKRKSSANQRANHFPRDVRYFRNEAQTILPAAQTIFAGRANHFAPCANHLVRRAQIILWSRHV